MPARLDGTPTNATPRVVAFIAALRARTTLPIVTEDERLTSREAESRLAVHERDWRKRKAQLDAAAAAIILQDYLDAPPMHEETRARVPRALVVGAAAAAGMALRRARSRTAATAAPSSSSRSRRDRAHARSATAWWRPASSATR